MSISEKLTTIAENEQKVFEAGKKAEWSKFWDVFQDYGNRTNYTREFQSSWNDTTFYPKYNIILNSCDSIFQGSKITNLKQRLIDCKVSLISERSTSLYYFGAASKITHCPEIGNELVGNTQNMFTNATSLISVDKITAKDGVLMQNSFSNAPMLEKITFCKNFAPIGLKLHGCTKLTKESLLNLANNLADKSEDTSGIDWAVTLGQTNLDKLTNEEKAIATEKGWTLA